MSNHTLYICYFGLREPLVQTQVLPYLREVKKLDDLQVSILTFEPDFKKKWTPEQIEAERKKLAAENINWYCLPYHKKPSLPATLYDVLSGARFVADLAKRENINVFHARSHVAALIGAFAKKSTREAKLIFDIRGFFPEEYVDAGVWKKDGGIYKLVKRVEKWLFRQADGFVVLTEKAKEILFTGKNALEPENAQKPIEVIPCCVDLKRFKIANQNSRQEIRDKLNLGNRRAIVYVGSFGGWYLTDEIMDFFKAAKAEDDSTFALVLTQSDKTEISSRLRNLGYTDKDFFVEKISPAEIPLYLSAADIALSFIKPCYSKQASSPTKFAEYLACGLPVVSNSGIGDLDKLIADEKVGVILDDFSEQGVSTALKEIDILKNHENSEEHYRQTAKKYFDLQTVGGESYRRLYQELLAKD